MKKILLIFICFLALRCIAQEYVDLGLPSGTLWKSKNESSHLNRKDALRRFGRKLPTQSQFMELISMCTWEWDGNSYRVTGPNGNSLVIPVKGWYFILYNFGNREVHYVEDVGNYWSSTKAGWWTGLFFNSDKIEVRDIYSETDMLSVRLVQNSENFYVDLGLPSGTLWKNQNENDFYNYDEAISSFGYSLPTTDQISELFSSCQWLWLSSGYKVVGPNGKSIFFPATGGYYSCDGVWNKKGKQECYWTRSINGLYDTGEKVQASWFGLGFDTSEEEPTMIKCNGNIKYNGCLRHAVRLVQNP